MNETDGGQALEELEAFRGAARMIVRAPDLDVKGKCLALLRLRDRAQGCAMPAWVEAAIFGEAAEFLGVAPVPPEVPGDPVELSARSLRARGYETCPTCARRLHDESDFARWRAIRRREVEEAERREAAVP